VLATYVGLAAFFIWRMLWVYTGPFAEYRAPTRRLLTAALRGDSTALVEGRTADSLAARLLALARSRPEQIDTISRLTVLRGERKGDTTLVTFYYYACDQGTLTASFLGGRRRPRAQELSLPCPSVRPVGAESVP